jgi:hypothetical protein
LDKSSRKAAKISIRAALASRARGLPMTEQEAIVWRRLAAVRTTQGDAAGLRVCLWAAGKALWVLAHRERCSDRTVANRIDSSLDAMRLDSREGLGRIEVAPDAAELKTLN